MNVRQIQSEEWQEYRAIRLAALADSPDAFGSKLGDEQALPEDRWRERTSGGTAEATRVLFVATDDSGRWVGLVGSFTPGDDPADTELISMWVDPSARGTGVGRQLVEAVMAWAGSQGFAIVGLWVTGTNASAIRLYERCGFVDNGERQRLPSNPDLDEVRMLRQA